MSRNGLVVREIRNEIEVVADFLTRNEVVEAEIKFKPGLRTLVGRTKDGDSIRLSLYDGDGFEEQTFSRCAPLAPAQRRREANRLRKIGYTQQEIANRLGCSQKTISLDLSRPSPGKAPVRR